MTRLTQGTIVSFLADIFTRRGHEEYLGEQVTMSAHMLQGAHFAAAEGQREEIIAAALLHDIGHFTSEFGSFTMNDTEDRMHEEAGAKVLAGFFPSVVTDCVRHHVAAKRYLCAVDPKYFDDLSDASVHSLALQGGPMSEAEVTAFEKLENARDIVQVRIYDDRGKVQGLEVPGFDHYRGMLQRVVDAYLVT